MAGERRFSRVNTALAGPILTYSELRLYIALRGFSNHNPKTCFPSRKRLACATQISEDKVRQLLYRLRRKGWVRWRDEENLRRYYFPRENAGTTSVPTSTDPVPESGTTSVPENGTSSVPQYQTSKQTNEQGEETPTPFPLKDLTKTYLSTTQGPSSERTVQRHLRAALLRKISAGKIKTAFMETRYQGWDVWKILDQVDPGANGECTETAEELVKRMREIEAQGASK